MDLHASRPRVLRVFVFAVVAAFLVWQVASKNVGQYLADVNPDAAIHLHDSNPTALLKLAESRLNRDQLTQDAEPATTASIPNPQAKAGIRGQLERALLSDPLNARALRILGQLALEASDEEQAKRFMQGAARRSLRESIAVYWLMRMSYDKRDYAAALRYADTLLRTRPQLIAQVMPILAAMAEDQDANGDLKKLLADNPPWRTQFFENLPTSISDARTPLDLYLSLKDTSHPSAIGDLRGYLNFLIGHKFHELAYYTWLQFLPPEQLSNAGLLFNGSFEGEPSGLPFDWSLMSGSGVTIDIAARPDHEEQRALYIEFGHGRVDFPEVSQMVMLAPGTYRFQGKYRGDIISQRGLFWRISCPSGTAIGQSAMVAGAAPAWKDFEFSFTVPGTDCRAQNVRLVLHARSASEQFVSGSIWYDDLRITRADKIVAQ